jgi:hypothetical protein
VSTLVVRQGSLTAEEAMSLSQTALDVPLEADADLLVVEITTAATVFGAFERTTASVGESPRLRRGSGGPFVVVLPGTLLVLLRLAHPSALVPSTPRQIMNRHVRPLLRGLTRSGALAHYFGRDTISVAHRPVGQVGFAHDSRTGRTSFEAFVAITAPLAPRDRPSLLGREPATLESAAGRGFDGGAVRGHIAAAYSKIPGCDAGARALERPASKAAELGEEPPWTSTALEAIGVVGAGVDGTGLFRVGGELLASRDALDRVARRAAALAVANAESVGRILDEELTPGSVALDGIRELSSVRDVLLAALSGKMRLAAPP